MLPALTFAKRPAIQRYRRLLLGGLGVALLVLVGIGTLLGTPAPSNGETAVPRSLADRLSISTWALAVPSSWLAAPLSDVRVGDSVDLLAVRGGDRPAAIAIAADLRVMSTDDRVVIFEVDEESATAIATARASGLLLVPLLRSTH